jgi:competence protein ComEC
VALKTPEGGFLLKLPFATLTEGETVRVEGYVRPLRGASGSGFREDRYWMARGITAQLTSTKTEALDNQAAAFWNIHRWRYSMYRFIAMYMPSLTGAYLNAAWTGKRDAKLNEAHRAWGTSHILAVSGFHVGIVMAGASFILKRGRWRVPLLSLVLWLYVLLTGAPASAARAGLMIQIALAGELVGRPGSAINSVSLAAVILLMLSPFWFWDVGWRLSVLAALGIAVVVERGNPRDWKMWLFMNFMIWLATFPQATGTFERVPLAGAFINLVAPQFFGFALEIASVVAAMRLLGVPVASFLASCVEGAFILWGILADGVVRAVPWQLGWNSFGACCCGALFIMFICRALFVPWRNVAVLAPLGALSAFALFVTI